MIPVATQEKRPDPAAEPIDRRCWKLLPRRSLFLVLGTYLALLVISLVVSERCNLGFRHPQWRMKQLAVLFDDAARNGSDIVYLGTSRMMAGVIPMEVDRAYAALKPGGTMRGHNLGVELCDWTMMYALLCRYLATAATGPRVVLVEVGMIDANRSQHRLLRNVARPQEVLDFLEEWTLLQSVELMFAVLGRGPQDLVGAAFCSKADARAVLGHAGWVLQTGAVGVSVSNKEAVLRLSLEDVLGKRARMSMDNEEIFGMPRRILKRIAARCEERGIRLLLVHVPHFKEPRLSQSRFDYLNTQGELLEPDYPTLYRPELFHEAVHLNEQGAVELSLEIGRYLAGERWPTVEEWLAGRDAR